MPYDPHLHLAVYRACVAHRRRLNLREAAVDDLCRRVLDSHAAALAISSSGELQSRAGGDVLDILRWSLDGGDHLLEPQAAGEKPKPAPLKSLAELKSLTASERLDLANGTPGGAPVKL